MVILNIQKRAQLQKISDAISPSVCTTSACLFFLSLIKATKCPHDRPQQEKQSTVWKWLCYILTRAITKTIVWQKTEQNTLSFRRFLSSSVSMLSLTMLFSEEKSCSSPEPSPIKACCVRIKNWSIFFLKKSMVLKDPCHRIKPV